MVTKTNNRMIDGAAVNVRDFGAVGDGVTDDTQAVLSAIEKANLTNSPVVFTNNTLCLVTSTQAFNRVSLVGDKNSGIVAELSTGNTIFKPIGADAYFRAEGMYFEYRGNWNTNRPYVCSIDDGTPTTLTHYEMDSCILFNIGDSAEMAEAPHVALSTNNIITTDSNTDIR